MDASTLYKAGQLGPAIEALGLELRKQPTDTRRRIFLFELLCFAGEYDRASKQLEVLASGGKDAESGAMLYRAALHAHRTREEMFERNELPVSSAVPSPAGTCDDVSFSSFVDEDDRIGANLEVFIAGSYTWIPFHYIESVELQAPTRLRTCFGLPRFCIRRRISACRILGKCFCPHWLRCHAGTPMTPSVWVAQPSGWKTATMVPFPPGQKIYLADETERPLLSIRDLQFQVPGGSDGEEDHADAGEEV